MLSRPKYTNTITHQVLIGALFALGLNSGALAADLTTSWRSSEAQQALQTWNSANFKGLKSQGSREKDPADSTFAHWKGVLLGDLVDQTLDTLPAERKAQVDLIVLKDQAGQESLIPRSLITKYPLLIANERNQHPLGLPTVVIPWTSKSKIKSEQLPLERFFVQKLVSIEFTTFATRFSPLFLKVRKDPVAVRGEKLFVQNCTGCHSGQSLSSLSLTDMSGEARTRHLASVGHPMVTGMPKLNDRDLRSLVSYLNAYRGEHASSTASSK